MLYQRELVYFLQFLESLEQEPINATKKNVLDYLQQADEKRAINRGTKQKLVSILNHYYTFLNQEFGAENIVRSIKHSRGKEKAS